MIWNLKLTQDRMKKMFGLEYNPKFFAFTMTAPHCYVLEKEIRERFWWKVEDTTEIWFTYLYYIDESPKILPTLKIPYKTRLDYQKFLLSWDFKDLPEWVKLKDLLH
jgi:hypothetical protein